MFAAGVMCGTAWALVMVATGANGIMYVDKTGAWAGVLAARMVTFHRPQVGSLHLVREIWLWCTMEARIQGKMTV